MRANASPALARVISQREVHARLTAMGLSVGFSDGAKLAAREQAYRATWAHHRASGFQPQ